MKCLRLLLPLLLIPLVMCSSLYAARGRPESTLVLVPVNERVVTFAFDLARLRSVDIVSYQPVSGTDAVALHVWDRSVGDWMRTSLEELANGQLFTQQPDQTVVLGTTPMIPASLDTALALLPGLVRIPTLDMATILNEMNAGMSFRPREWEWLAGRHGVELKDGNYARRRWGRYGPPGGAAVRSRSTSSSEEALVPEPVPADIPDVLDVEPLDVGDAPEMAAPQPAERQRIVIPIGAPASEPAVEAPPEPELLPAPEDK